MVKAEAGLEPGSILVSGDDCHLVLVQTLEAGQWTDRYCSRLPIFLSGFAFGEVVSLRCASKVGATVSKFGPAITTAAKIGCARVPRVNWSDHPQVPTRRRPPS